MTARSGPIPVPARITSALDRRGLDGDQVDRDLGVWESPTGEWEPGTAVVRSWIDERGVLHIEQETPDRPPYRPRKPAPQPAREAAMPRPTTSTRQGRGQPHVASEDPQAPGCCATCHKPLSVWSGGKLRPAPNPLHVDSHADIPPSPPGPQDLAAGREDS